MLSLLQTVIFPEDAPGRLPGKKLKFYRNSVTGLIDLRIDQIPDGTAEEVEYVMREVEKFHDTQSKGEATP